MTAHVTKISPVDVVPLVLARPILAPPPIKDDPALYAFWCPYDRVVKLLPEDLTIWPHAIRDTLGRTVVLQRGSAVFIGVHLLAGYPDALSPRLQIVLNRLYGEEIEKGNESRWVVNAPIQFAPDPERATRGRFKKMTKPGETGQEPQIALASPELANASVGNEDGKTKVTTNA